MSESTARLYSVKAIPPFKPRKKSGKVSALSLDDWQRMDEDELREAYISIMDEFPLKEGLGGIAGFVTSTAQSIFHPVATGKGLWQSITYH
jgi:hypothetical protein